MFPVEHIIPASILISQLEKEGSDTAQVVYTLRALGQILEKQYRIGLIISLIVEVENRTNLDSKYLGWSVEQICLHNKVPKSTFYDKKKKYETNGVWGLVAKKPGPKTGSRLEPVLKRRVEELRDLKLPVSRICEMISGQTLNKKRVAVSTAYRYLKSKRKNQLPRNYKPPKKAIKRFERDKPNEMWQIDNVGPFYKPAKLYAYDIVDDHSRYSLGVMVSANQKTASWVAFFEKLFLKYGNPQSILHDNGSQFVRNDKLTNDIKKLFETHKIKSIRSSYAHPQTCGKVERFQQSLEFEARDIVHTNSIAELQHAFDAWRDFYNMVRVNSETEVTPYERYYGHKADSKQIQQVCLKYEKMLKHYQPPD